MKLRLRKRAIILLMAFICSACLIIAKSMQANAIVRLPGVISLIEPIILPVINSSIAHDEIVEPISENVAEVKLEPEKVIVKDSEKIMPAWGKYDKETYYTLAAVIYLEAGAGMSLESGCAVGWVVRNRSESSIWGKASISDQIYRSGQFSVVGKSGSSTRKRFTKLTKDIAKMDNAGAKIALQSAKYVLQGRNKYKLPTSVMYFHGNENKRKWGKHIFYKEIGGNAFFHDKRAKK